MWPQLMPALRSPRAHTRPGPAAEAIVDIATLTGACMIALGDSVAGLFTPSDEMAAALGAAAKEAGERGGGEVKRALSPGPGGVG